LGVDVLSDKLAGMPIDEIVGQTARAMQSVLTAARMARALDTRCPSASVR
jgi:hypothetical protein